MERWKDIQIKGFGNYQISNGGRVRDRVRIGVGGFAREHNLLQRISYKTKQMEIDLTSDSGKTEAFDVGRLVALHFVSKPIEVLKLTYLGSSLDNRAANLKWVIAEEVEPKELSVGKRKQLRRFGKL